MLVLWPRDTNPSLSIITPPSRLPSTHRTAVHIPATACGSPTERRRAPTLHDPTGPFYPHLTSIWRDNDHQCLRFRARCLTRLTGRQTRTLPLYPRDHGRAQRLLPPRVAPARQHRSTTERARRPLTSSRRSTRPSFLMSRRLTKRWTSLPLPHPRQRQAAHTTTARRLRFPEASRVPVADPVALQMQITAVTGSMARLRRMLSADGGRSNTGEPPRARKGSRVCTRTRYLRTRYKRHRRRVGARGRLLPRHRMRTLPRTWVIGMIDSVDVKCSLRLHVVTAVDPPASVLICFV